MAIQGDLKEFTVPELFQFMHQHSKSGCIHIMEERQELVIYFQEGRIVGVYPKAQSPVDFWCEILSRAGYLIENREKGLRKRKSYDLTSFREILVREGIVSSEELEELLMRQSQELLFRALKLRKGSFSLSAEENVPADLRLSEPIFVEAFLLDGLRMLDEWPVIRKRIGSFSRVPYRQYENISSPVGQRGKMLKQGLWHKVLSFFRVLPAPAPHEDVQSKVEGSLSPIEAEVYRLVDGKHNIQHIIDGSICGEYKVCKALLGLLEGGLIELHSPVYGREVVGERAKGLSRSLVQTFWFLLAVFSLLVLIYAIGIGAREKDTFWKRFPEEQSMLISRHVNQQRRQIVEHALEMYIRERGAYPESLEMLVSQNLLKGRDVHLLGRNSYRYSSLGSTGYTLIIVPQADLSAAGITND